MSVSEHALKAGLKVLLLGVEATFLGRATQQVLEFQRTIHAGTSSVTIDNPGQYTAPDGTFLPNKEQAKERAKTTIQMGIGRRLEGAIALYGIGEQMECLRHIILALDSVFCILEWKEASAWCNTQNYALYEAHKRKQAA